jgi:hypothetical protein
MSIVDEIKKYYEDNEISPMNFKCKHLKCCKRNCENFTEAREPYIGERYENENDVPKLLFLSLDSGHGEDEREARTIEAMRSYEEMHGFIEASKHKQRHWYRTYELAFTLLRQFKPEIPFQDVHRYFSHTNSAKCCLNNERNAQADYMLFKNCRGYIAGEIEIFKPDILITQGNMALCAVEPYFDVSVHGDQKKCGYSILKLKCGHQVLWFHTYHPRYFGGFNRQRRECWSAWVKTATQFIHSKAFCVQD